MGEKIKFAPEMIQEVYQHIEAPTKLDKSTKEDKRLLPTLQYFEDKDVFKDETVWELAEAEYPWHITRKLDGTNLRVYWDGDRLYYAGKTVKSELNIYSGIQEYMESVFSEELFEEVIGRKSALLIFELMGRKIQKNELELSIDEPYKAVLVDVKIGNVWLQWFNRMELAESLNLPCIDSYQAYMFGDIDDEEEAGNLVYQPHQPLVQLINHCVNGAFKDFEGIVATPVGGLRDKFGNRIIVKIKNRDYFKEGK